MESNSIVHFLHTCYPFKFSFLLKAITDCFPLKAKKTIPKPPKNSFHHNVSLTVGTPHSKLPWSLTRAVNSLGYTARKPKHTPFSHTNMATPLPYFDGVAYTVQLEGTKVSTFYYSPSVTKSVEPDHTGDSQTMVNSATHFSFLLGQVYTALKSEFVKQTKGILRALNNPNFVFERTMDLCYRVEQNRTVLPPLRTVNLLFRGVDMSVYEERLLYKVEGANRGSDGIKFDIAKPRVVLAKFKCDLASQ